MYSLHFEHNLKLCTPLTHLEEKEQEPKWQETEPNISIHPNLGECPDANQILASLTANDTLIWTDGSCGGNPGIGGAAIFVQSPHQHIHNYKYLYSLSTLTTSLACEYIAIQIALEFILSTPAINTPHQRVIVLSDCKPALYSSMGIYDPPKSSYCQFIQTNKSIINNLLCTPELYWVRAHVGIPGNEKVDKLAKRAQKAAVHMFNHHQNTIPQYVFNPNTTKSFHDIWSQYYSTRFSHYHIYKYIPIPNQHIDPSLLKLSRLQLCVVSRLITGACRLNHYLHSISCVNSPLCDFCVVTGEQSDETVDHFLIYCPYFEIQRQELFKNIQHLLNVYKISKIRRINSRLLLTGNSNIASIPTKLRIKIVQLTANFIINSKRKV